MNSDDVQYTRKIADLNDQLRKDMFTGNMLKKHRFIFHCWDNVLPGWL